jgi:hypothetical protein
MKPRQEIPKTASETSAGAKIAIHAAAAAIPATAIPAPVLIEVQSLLGIDEQ